MPLALVAYFLVARREPVSRGQAVAFAAAQLLLLAVSVTPIATISLEYLLSAHLLQNVVLAEWAPALIVFALPAGLAARAARQPLVHRLTQPAVALAVWLGIYFLWHLPWAYDAALEHPATLLHAEHACYLLAGLLLWWPVLRDEPHHLSEGQRAGYLFAAFVASAPLGLLLALLPEPIYSFYEEAPRLWGLSALTDQQIAGVTMSGEQAIVFFAAFAVYFLRFLAAEDAEGAALDTHGPGRRS